MSDGFDDNGGAQYVPDQRTQTLLKRMRDTVGSLKTKIRDLQEEETTLRAENSKSSDRDSGAWRVASLMVADGLRWTCLLQPSCYSNWPACKSSEHSKDIGEGSVHGLGVFCSYLGGGVCVSGGVRQAFCTTGARIVG